MDNKYFINNNGSSFIPVIVYNNADTEKLRILTDNKGLAGIYMWTHLESGKRYVGSSTDLSRRFRRYYSISHLTRYNSMLINKALLKYGYSNFSLTIIEHLNVANLSNTECKNLILEREQFYLNLIQPECNILKFAGSSQGYNHTEKSLIKISNANKGSLNSMFGKIGENHPMFGKIGENNPMYGKVHNEETRNKISIAIKGNIHTKETREKISLAKKGISKTEEHKAKISLAMSTRVYTYTVDTNNLLTLYKLFNNRSDAAKEFNCSTATISRYRNTKRLLHNKWILSSTLLI